jgi:hypothetical protein
MPDRLPRPPGRPPEEPIIIRNPPRPPEVPEIDRSLDEEDDLEIEKLPEIVPEMPPPQPPEDRPHRALFARGETRGNRLGVAEIVWSRLEPGER